MATLALIVPMIVLPNKRVQGNMREKLLRVDYAGSLLTIASSILVLVRTTAVLFIRPALTRISDRTELVCTIGHG
jgi:hypothetical protein